MPLFNWGFIMFIDVWSFNVHMLGFVTFNHYVKENWFRKTCFVSLSIVLDRVSYWMIS